ncbi:hypothetical protein GCM10022226_61480 [Sphaerisporangium flaviroseum]|uniref:Uncharacterized protein n=1 Tax=Sphaerisporangium flaviroseum TaxID=509199 RepID=A0ABP7J250_9ACTN
MTRGVNEALIVETKTRTPLRAVTDSQHMHGERQRATLRRNRKVVAFMQLTERKTEIVAARAASRPRQFGKHLMVFTAYPKQRIGSIKLIRSASKLSLSLYKR